MVPMWIDYGWSPRRTRRGWSRSTASPAGSGLRSDTIAEQSLVDVYGPGRERQPAAHEVPGECLVVSQVGLGFALRVARNLRALNRLRAVISTVDICGLELALLEQERLFNRGPEYICQRLSDRVAAHDPVGWLSSQYRDLFWAPMTLSAGTRTGLATWLGVPGERMRALPFRTDREFGWNTVPSEDASVLGRPGGAAERSLPAGRHKGGGEPWRRILPSNAWRWR